MGKMLETKFDCDESCLSCGSTETETVEVTLKRAEKRGNIITFHLCKKCLKQLAWELHPFS